MDLWIEHWVALEHYNNLLREAEQERLVRRALEEHPKNQKAWCKAMGWLGSRLSAWGNQLQERYGAATTNTAIKGRLI